MTEREVLGLGDIGPEGALPVMEGKSVLFKILGGINAFPLCIDTKDKEEIIRFVKAIHPVFGAVNIEDIESPKGTRDSRKASKRSPYPSFPRRPAWHCSNHPCRIIKCSQVTAKENR